MAESMGPTYEECLAAAYEEYVRSWLEEHPLLDVGDDGLSPQ